MPSQGREGEGPPSAVGLGTAVSLALGPLIGMCGAVPPSHLTQALGTLSPGKGSRLSLGWVLKAGRPKPLPCLLPLYPPGLFLPRCSAQGCPEHLHPSHPAAQLQALIRVLYLRR